MVASISRPGVQFTWPKFPPKNLSENLPEKTSHQNITIKKLNWTFRKILGNILGRKFWPCELNPCLLIQDNNSARQGRLLTPKTSSIYAYGLPTYRYLRGLPCMMSAKGFFYLPPSHKKSATLCSFCLLLGDPLPPPSADVIYGSPLPPSDLPPPLGMICGT